MVVLNVSLVLQENHHDTHTQNHWIIADVRLDLMKTPQVIVFLIQDHLAQRKVSFHHPHKEMK